MALTSRFLYIVGMDIDREREGIFNTLHDREHIPNLLSVPGVVSGTRFRRRSADVIIDGKKEALELSAAEPTYYALYELERTEVLISPEWVQAGKGEWSRSVSPFITNRRRLLLERA